MNHKTSRFSALFSVLGSIAVAVLLGAVLALAGCAKKPSPCGKGKGNIKDEALCAGRSAETLPGADDDYLADMDYGVTKNPQEVAARLQPYVPGITPEEAVKRVHRGRNNWIIWSGGNDRLWDVLSVKSIGNLDFLKTLSNHPSLQYSRDNRWQFLGVVNEPCFEKAKGPRPDRFGLRLDTRRADCPPDPYEDEKKYPGVKIGARGTGDLPVGSYYGYATGVVGLRLFPNPAFDEAARRRWDPERFYTDKDYYADKDLVRPYRVGMSCGFCHVGPNPSNPPADPENPKWENLSSNPGAQYFWWDRIFIWNPDPKDFPWQLFHVSRPGALDTSMVSTDYIANPRTMNAVYNFGARMVNALRFGQEGLAGAELDNAQFDDYAFIPKNSVLHKFYEKPMSWTPRVLKDGADSVGALGALNRVFVNIGLFSEEWLLHFNALVGGKKITPFPIETARKNSAYWQATEAQTPDTALFFLATSRPDYLKDAPGGQNYLRAEAAVLDRGKAVFGERCARCHSSKLPPKAYTFFPNGCVGPNYLECWNKYWAWTKTDEFKAEITPIVMAPDFLEDNYLSTELRVPVTLLETNACSPLATNAIRKNIWDNFSSDAYKSLPSVGSVTVHHPITGEPWDYPMPAGGRGYTRPPSLVSLWSTAPFLLNNTVGKFEWSGSVEDRMKSFDDAIEQMLWPAKRSGDRTFKTASGLEHPGIIDVTTEESALRLPRGYLPRFLRPELGVLERLLPWLFTGEGIELGPIPKGTPIGLISNLDLERKKELLPVFLKLKSALKEVAKKGKAEAVKVYEDKGLVDAMLKVNKCPDFVVNRGHYFGTEYFKEEPGLGDEDKKALIAFLKTM